MSRLAALLLKVRVGETDLQSKWLRRNRPHPRGIENGGQVRRFHEINKAIFQVHSSLNNKDLNQLSP